MSFTKYIPLTEAKFRQYQELQNKHIKNVREEIERPATVAPLVKAYDEKQHILFNKNITPEMQTKLYHELTHLVNQLKQKTAAGVPVQPSKLPALSIGVPAQPVGVPARSGEVPAYASKMPASGGEVPAYASKMPASGGDVPAHASKVPAYGGDTPVALSSGAASYRAQRVLDALGPNVWNENKELVIDGHPISGSSREQLMDYAASNWKSKYTIPPVGANELVELVKGFPSNMLGQGIQKHLEEERLEWRGARPKKRSRPKNVSELTGEDILNSSVLFKKFMQ